MILTVLGGALGIFLFLGGILAVGILDEDEVDTDTIGCLALVSLVVCIVAAILYTIFS